MAKEDKMHHFVYKTTNMINGKYYIGVHNTDNLNDGYMGSGVALKRAIKRYGKRNFNREILKTFNSADAAFEYEAVLVDEAMAADRNVYNVALGGHQNQFFRGTVAVKDSSGQYFRVSVDDPEYLSGKYTSPSTGMHTVIGPDGKVVHMSTTDKRFLSGEFRSITKGKIGVRDINGNRFQVNVGDPDFESGLLVGISKGFVIVKDSFGKIHRVSTSDPRILSGEFVGIAKGRVNVRDNEGNQFQVDINDSRYLSGELVSCTKSGILVTCPHCGKVGGDAIMKRWHFDNCLDNPKIDIQSELTKRKNLRHLPKSPDKQATCPFCGKSGYYSNINKHHFENCSKNPSRIIKRRTCPHCGLIGRGCKMVTHHFDNCKQHPKNKTKL